MKAAPENSGKFVDHGSTLEIRIALSASGPFEKAKLTLPDEIRNLVKSGKGSVTVNGNPTSFKANILDATDSYEGILLKPGDTEAKIVLDKISAEAYVAAPGGTKATTLSVTTVGSSDSLKAYIGNNLNTRNQDYAFNAPAAPGYWVLIRKYGAGSLRA